MTPTTRETADHAELARDAEVLIANYAYGDDRNALGRKIQSALSEIAALRGERDRWHSAYEIAHDQATSNGSAARQAERQRDEARAVIKDVDQAARQAASMDEAGYTVTVQRTATHIYGITAAFLATQGDE